MRRVDLEHVVAAAAQISNEVEFVVIGSQAILATDDPPPNLLRSMEADIYPRRAPQKAEEIDIEDLPIDEEDRAHGRRMLEARPPG